MFCNKKLILVKLMMGELEENLGKIGKEEKVNIKIKINQMAGWKKMPKRYCKKKLDILKFNQSGEKW